MLSFKVNGNAHSDSQRLKHLILCVSPSYLQVVQDHFSKLLHRCASGGLVEHRGLSAWLRLLAQLVVHDLPQPTADDAVQVSPASCVHLTNTGIERAFRKLKISVNQKEAFVSYLVIWQRRQTPTHVQRFFVAQTAAGRAIDDPLPVFITLRKKKCAEERFKIKPLYLFFYSSIVFGPQGNITFSGPQQKSDHTEVY